MQVVSDCGDEHELSSLEISPEIPTTEFERGMISSSGGTRKTSIVIG